MLSGKASFWFAQMEATQPFDEVNDETPQFIDDRQGDFWQEA